MIVKENLSVSEKQAKVTLHQSEPKKNICKSFSLFQMILKMVHLERLGIKIADDFTLKKSPKSETKPYLNQIKENN